MSGGGQLRTNLPGDDFAAILAQLTQRVASLEAAARGPVQGWEWSRTTAGQPAVKPQGGSAQEIITPPTTDAPQPGWVVAGPVATATVSSAAGTVTSAPTVVLWQNRDKAWGADGFIFVRRRLQVSFFGAPGSTYVRGSGTALNNLTGTYATVVTGMTMEYDGNNGADAGGWTMTFATDLLPYTLGPGATVEIGWEAQAVLDAGAGTAECTIDAWPFLMSHPA